MRMRHVAVCTMLWSALGLTTSADVPTAQAPPAPQVVEMTAERFSFTPSEIKVKAGVPIEFRIVSDDTDHGFRILDTDINVRIPKRGKGTATVKFTPPAAGRYTIECSHVCGAGHSFMRATLVVGAARERP